MSRVGETVVGTSSESKDAFDPSLLGFLERLRYRYMD